jgi:SpoIID/LytB domain protein
MDESHGAYHVSTTNGSIRFRNLDGTVSQLLPAGHYTVVAGASPGYLVVRNGSGKTVVSGVQSPLLIIPTTEPLTLDDTSMAGYTGGQWAGSFRVLRPNASSAALDLVDYVGIERYVEGIVPNEMTTGWPMEALKVQAVCARSYAYSTMNHDPTSEFDAWDGVRSQQYGPIGHQHADTSLAVTSTANQVVKYQGAVATTFFSSSSGGMTSSIAASWGGTNQPYLVPVVDSYDAAGGLNPNHTWAPKLYGPASLAAALHIPGEVNSIDQTVDPASLRELTLTLHTTQGNVSKLGRTVASTMGLRSSFFRVLQVTLNAPKSVVKGKPLLLTGRVWPKPSTPVHIQVRNAGSTTWQTLADRPALAANGSFKMVRFPAVSVSYRVVRTSAFSPVVSVTVTGGRAAGGLLAPSRL